MLDVLYTYGPTGFSGRHVRTNLFLHRPLRWLASWIFVWEPFICPRSSPPANMRHFFSGYVGFGWRGRNFYVSLHCPLGRLLDLILPRQRPRKVR